MANLRERITVLAILGSRRRLQASRGGGLLDGGLLGRANLLQPFDPPESRQQGEIGFTVRMGVGQCARNPSQCVPESEIAVVVFGMNAPKKFEAKATSIASEYASNALTSRTAQGLSPIVEDPVALRTVTTALRPEHQTGRELHDAA